MTEPITITITGLAGFGAGGALLYLAQRFLSNKANNTMPNKCPLHDNVVADVKSLHAKIDKVNQAVARIEGKLG